MPDWHERANGKDRIKTGLGIKWWLDIPAQWLSVRGNIPQMFAVSGGLFDWSRWRHLGDATGLYWAMVGVVSEHAVHGTAPTTVTQPQGSTVLQLRNPALELDVNSWEPSGHQGAQVTVTSWETLGKLVNLLVISKQGCFWVETEHPYLNLELRQHDYVYRLKRLSKLNEALEKRFSVP